VRLIIHLRLVPMLRILGAMPPVPHTSSWRGTQLSTRTTLSFTYVLIFEDSSVSCHLTYVTARGCILCFLRFERVNLTLLNCKLKSHFELQRNLLPGMSYQLRYTYTFLNTKLNSNYIMKGPVSSFIKICYRAQ
jgi:hypothetical protein